MSEGPDLPGGDSISRARRLQEYDVVELITALEATRRRTGSWNDGQVRELIRRYGESLDQLRSLPIADEQGLERAASV